MKKFMKVAKIALAGVLTLAMMAGVTGCGKKEGVSNDEKTLNVRIYKAGWGDDYVRAWAAAFESLYAKEGYKVNIVSSDSTLQGSVITTEMLLCENNGIDLYFGGGVSSDSLVRLSRENDVDIIAADLTDVYNSKPIRADGTEENVTLSEKFKEGYGNLLSYKGDDEEAKGKYYTFGVASAPSGLFVNEDLLASYELELPNTTDELIECFNVIQTTQAESGVYPTAWAGLNAYTYWYMVEDVWAAQYDGIDAYNNFLSMNYSDKVEDGWRVYESQGWRESIDVLSTLTNLDYAPNKTISMDHTTAQHHFLSGEAVFMVNGAWLQNEMSANYLEQVKKIKMMKTPIVSALGVKLGLDGNGGQDAEKCDAVLSQIVDLIDAGKTVDEIVKEVGNVTNEQVVAVVEARSIHYDWSGTGGTVINAYSPKVDIAKLFLRFIASDDGIKLYYDYASGFSALEPTEDIGYTTDSEFWNSVYAISNEPGAQHIFRNEQGWRNILSITCFGKHSALEKELASAKGTMTGDQVMDDELEYAKKVFTERLAEYNQ